MNIRRGFATSAFCSFLTLAVLPVPAGHAAEGGYSNYIPGTYGDFGMALEPAGKLTLRNDLYYYGADTEQSVRSGRSVFDMDLTFFMNFTTLVYKPEVQFLGGQYAFGVFIPLVYVELEADLGTRGMTRGVEDDAAGLGDLVWIPILLYWNHGNLNASFAQFIVSPTGDYSTNNLVNAGLNYWSFDSNVAVTYFNGETGQDYSVNLGWLYNTENEDTDYQTGQELHVDYIANQWFSETFALGVEGFYMDQINGDSGSGAVLGDFKAQAAGIGPAVLWATKFGKQDVTFIAKWLHEFHAENRLEGDNVFLSFSMDW